MSISPGISSRISKYTRFELTSKLNYIPAEFWKWISKQSNQDYTLLSLEANFRPRQKMENLKETSHPETNQSIYFWRRAKPSFSRVWSIGTDNSHAYTFTHSHRGVRSRLGDNSRGRQLITFREVKRTEESGIVLRNQNCRIILFPITGAVQFPPGGRSRFQSFGFSDGLSCLSKPLRLLIALVRLRFDSNDTSFLLVAESAERSHYIQLPDVTIIISPLLLLFTTE